MKAESQQQIEKAAQPLAAIWKILTFIFPIFFGFVISASLIRKGYFRKGSELKTWTYYGLLFYIILIAMAELLIP